MRKSHKQITKSQTIPQPEDDDLTVNTVRSGLIGRSRLEKSKLVSNLNTGKNRLHFGKLSSVTRNKCDNAGAHFP